MFTFTSITFGMTPAGSWGRYTSPGGKFVQVSPQSLHTVIQPQFTALIYNLRACILYVPS